MKNCSKCGAQLSEGANFCPNCGNPCESSFSQSPQENDVAEKVKKSKLPIKRLLSIILIIALIGGGCFVWRNLGNNYSLEGLAKACVKYDWVSDFHDGLARVGKADRWGYIDKNGIEVIPCIYESVEDEYYDGDFHDGLALVYKDGKCSFINTKGEEAFTFNYDWAKPFSDGLAAVCKDEKYGYIDTKGAEVLPLSDKYSGENFSDGLAAIWKDGKYGFIDKSGKIVIPCQYESLSDMGEAASFHEGLAAIWKNDRWGYVDKTGKEVIPFKFTSASDFSEGLAFVRENDKKEYIDKTGSVVISCDYEWCSDFHDGLAIVQKSNKVGYIDKTGKEVIPFKFTSASDFSEGLSSVYKNDRWGYIDLKGNSTFDVKDEEVEQFVQQQKEEKEKQEAEKRKRIEEENKPINRFYSLASQNQYAWVYQNANFDLGYAHVLYFYPTSKSEGYVSRVKFNKDYSGYFRGESVKTTYKILDGETISFSVSGTYNLHGDTWSEHYNMKIEKDGDNIVLVHKNPYGVILRFKNAIPRMSDPIK